jgi:hypothetical protein
MTTVGHALLARKDYIDQYFRAIGHEEPFPGFSAYEGLSSDILDVANSALKVLETEGAARRSSSALLAKSQLSGAVPAQDKAKSSAANSFEEPSSPDDPRYKYWVLIRTFLQREESQGRSEIIKAFEQNGAIQTADVIKFVQGSFDSMAKAIVITVNGAATVDRRTRDLDELFRRFLNYWKDRLVGFAPLVGMAASDLETAIRVGLTTRLESWKQEAFHLALENEIARSIEESPPATSNAVSGATFEGCERR